MHVLDDINDRCVELWDIINMCFIIAAVDNPNSFAKMEVVQSFMSFIKLV